MISVTQAPPPDSALDLAQEPGQPALVVITGDDGLRHADCLGEELLRDPCGFILTRTESRLAFGNGRALLMFETNLPRVFAIGVIRSGSSKRVILAADVGASAAAMVREYQASLCHEQDAAGG